jgi:GNAT superfamily N-acetyltransferase
LLQNKNKSVIKTPITYLIELYLNGRVDLEGVGGRDGAADAQILTAQVEKVHRGDGLGGRLRRVVLDEAVALVFGRRAARRQSTRLNWTKCLKYTAKFFYFNCGFASIFRIFWTKFQKFICNVN